MFEVGELTSPMGAVYSTNGQIAILAKVSGPLGPLSGVFLTGAALVKAERDKAGQVIAHSDNLVVTATILTATATCA